MNKNKFKYFNSKTMASIALVGAVLIPISPLIVMTGFYFDKYQDNLKEHNPAGEENGQEFGNIINRKTLQQSGYDFLINYDIYSRKPVKDGDIIKYGAWDKTAISTSYELEESFPTNKHDINSILIVPYIPPANDEEFGKILYGEEWFNVKESNLEIDLDKYATNGEIPINFYNLENLNNGCKK